MSGFFYTLALMLACSKETEPSIPAQVATALWSPLLLLVEAKDCATPGTVVVGTAAPVATAGKSPNTSGLKTVKASPKAGEPAKTNAPATKFVASGTASGGGGGRKK